MKETEQQNIMRESKRRVTMHQAMASLTCISMMAIRVKVIGRLIITVREATLTVRIVTVTKGATTIKFRTSIQK